MPETRLQRTRDAYPSDQLPTITEVLDALPKPHLCEYRIVTDPQTGITERVDLPLQWRPRHENAAAQLKDRLVRTGQPPDAWNVIEGDA